MMKFISGAFGSGFAEIRKAHADASHTYTAATRVFVAFADVTTAHWHRFCVNTRCAGRRVAHVQGCHCGLYGVRRCHNRGQQGAVVLNFQPNRYEIIPPVSSGTSLLRSRPVTKERAGCNVQAFQFAIIDAETPFSILFPGKNNRCSPWAN